MTDPVQPPQPPWLERHKLKLAVERCGVGHSRILEYISGERTPAPWIRRELEVILGREIGRRAQL